jgi:amino acid transporter
MWHAMAVCVGMVIGAGIFVTTPLAAENVTSPTLLLALWAFCGAMSLAGALCFAEMAAAFPDAGGDYFFLRKAYGRDVGFLFAWSRFAVIHTGSMALLAFALGDYVAEALQVGEHTSTGFAALAIVLIAAVNLVGIRLGAGSQVVLMAGVVAGLLAVVAAGIWIAVGGADGPQAPGITPTSPLASRYEIGAALVFIFLAYGGWSDAATLSAEMRDPDRGMRRALVGGMTLVTLLYLAVNWAFLRGLTSYGLAHSSAPAADLMLQAFGRPGQILIVLAVALTSITSMNAILISGARTTYAAARDTGSSLSTLTAWNVLRGTPSTAILAISGLALLLVGFGAYTRGGFATMVDFLSPVYWLFLTLSGIALFVLRHRYPDARRPFRAPLYPWIPIAFVASSAYVFYSSLAYVKTGALVGMGVLLIGALLLLALRVRGRHTSATRVPD